MRIGKWWLSPGRRIVEPRTFTVPWLWVERDPYSFRVVLWGGAPGRDVQVGSRVDRIRQANLDRRARQRRAMIHMTMTFRDQVTPVMRQLSEQVAQLGRASRPLAQLLRESERR
jgi:hypothetical protein